MNSTFNVLFSLQDFCNYGYIHTNRPTSALAYEMRDIAEDVNSVRHKGLAKMVLGAVALNKDEIERSRQYYDDALSLVTDHDYGLMNLSELGLSRIAWADEDCHRARQHLRRGFELANQPSTSIFRGDSLVQAAHLLAEARRLIRAVEILAFALTCSGLTDRRHVNCGLISRRNWRLPISQQPGHAEKPCNGKRPGMS